MTIGERIRKERLAHGLTITELAERIGVTRSAVGQWENGRTEPTRENVRAVATALGIQPQQLDPSSGNTATRILPSTYTSQFPC